jgi:hypothetical protein
MEHFTLTIPAPVSLMFCLFFSSLWCSYSQMSGKANWLHSRKDYMTWHWQSSMSLALCECLETKQASFSTVACNLFLIFIPRRDPKQLWLGNRDGYRVTRVKVITQLLGPVLFHKSHSYTVLFRKFSSCHIIGLYKDGRFNIVFSGAQPRQFVWIQRFGDYIESCRRESFKTYKMEDLPILENSQ